MMASGKYELYSYVDALSPERLWQSAQVRELHEDHGVYVEFTGKRLESGEYIKNQARLAPFRTKTKGICWKEGEVYYPPISVYQHSIEKCQKALAEIVQGGTLGTSPSDIIKKYRGECFFMVYSILRGGVASDLFPSALNFLQEYVQAVIWWLQTLQSRAETVLTVGKEPNLAYSNVDAAVASLCPELMQGFGFMLNVDHTQQWSFPVANTRELDPVLAEWESDSVPMLTWRMFQYYQGVEALMDAVQAL